MNKGIFGSLGGILAGLMFGALVWGKSAPAQQATPDVIRAHQLQIVDNEGNARIILAVDTDGTARIRLQGKTGTPAIGIILDPDKGAGIVIRDKRGKDRIRLDHVEDMRSAIALLDDSQQPAVSLGLTHDGLRVVQLSNGLDPTGSLMLHAGPGHKPTIALIGSNGKTRDISP